MTITFQRRRLILKIAAFGVILYGTLALIWANLIPNLGIHVFGTQVVGTSTPPVFGAEPQSGDQILAIGTGPNIDSWPGYLHVLHHLRDRYFAPQPHVAAADLATVQHPDVLDENGRRLVRVKFQGISGVYSSWFEVRPFPWQRTAISVLWAAVQSALFALGWLVSRRRPADDAAAIFFLNCILTVGAYIGGHHWLQLATQPALTFVFAICAMALPQINLHFYLLFPTPKRWVVRHPKTVLFLLYILPGLFQVAVLWSIGSVYSTFRQDPGSLAHLQSSLAIMRTLVWIYVAISAVMFAGCVAAMSHSYFAARRPLQRNQMRWILAGAFVASLFVAYSLFLTWRDPIGFALGSATWSMFGASLAFTAAHAVAVARYRLTDAGTIVQRSKLYLGVSFLGSLAYFGLILILAVFVPQLAGMGGRPEALLASTSIILILLVANTVRANVQKIVDRRFFREKHSLERTVRRMGEAVEKLAHRDAVWSRCLDVAADTLNAHAAAAYRRDFDGAFVRVHQDGPATFPESIARDHQLAVSLEKGSLLQKNLGPVLPGDAVTPMLRKLDTEIAQPIIYQDELLGFLLFANRDEGVYGADELTFLAGLAAVSAAAIHGAETQATLERLNADLRDKITRLTSHQQRIDTLRRSASRQTDNEPNTFDELRGNSPAVRELASSVRKIAASQATVLIRGESGTGKTLLAELLHRQSPRSAAPFVTVHCASLSPGVLESELFGHVKGAFTGAHRDKVGRFELADRGTLFLDEIGDVTLDVQTKLLRVIQEMTFEPVGASSSKKVNVRIIAATNQSLENLIRSGKFREDLFYRLNVISLRTPPLRERQEDVLELASHFIMRFAERTGKTVEGMDDEVAETLLNYPWPGNIRQLENMMERAVVMAEQRIVTVADLPEELFAPPPAKLAQTAAAKITLGRVDEWPASLDNSSNEMDTGLASEMESLERIRLVDALNAANGNKSKAARALGFRRTTFCSKLKKHGIS